MITHLTNQNCETCASKSSSNFCYLKENESLIDSKLKKLSSLKKGQILIRAGNSISNVFCIKKGKLKIIKSSIDGKESIMHIARPGDILGQECLSSVESAEYSAIALEEVEVCSIEQKIITEYLHHTPSVRLAIIEKLSEKIDSVESQIFSAKENSVKERLIILLLWMRKNYGILDSEAYRIDLRLTRAEMAMFVGTSNETIIRFLTILEKENIINYKGKVLYIRDLNKLEKLHKEPSHIKNNHITQ